MYADYTIDEITEDDLDEILEIERASFPSPWSKDLFERELENSFSFNLAARRPEPNTPSVIGYIVFWEVADEMHILDLAVHGDFRRQGIAKSLLGQAIDTGRKRGCYRFILDVRRDNKAAIDLYRSYFFREIGARRAYYKDGEDAIVMALEI